MFLESADTFTLHTLENFQEYYESKRSASKERLAFQKTQEMDNDSMREQECFVVDGDSDEFSTDDLIAHATPFEARSAGVGKTYNKTIRAQLSSNEFNLCMSAFSSSMTRISERTKYVMDSDEQQALSKELAEIREK